MTNGNGFTMTKPDAPVSSTFVASFIGILIVVGYMVTLGALIYLKNPDDHDLKTGMTQAMMTMATLVVGYYFGTSKGSADKTAIMAAAANATPAPGSTQPAPSGSVTVTAQPPAHVETNVTTGTEGK